MIKNKISSFKDFIVWQKSIELFKLLIKDLERFPRERASYVVTDQILRSVSSISANIAEGFGRKGRKEFAQFLGISKGSANESEDWYEKIRILKYLPEDVVNERIALIAEIKKMLNVLISKVKQ
ncbi:MAG: four helix bundle protein [Candidatus Pacebacteria bacterium]|nr:four helix bundle protein [Candidatus Paceibacterota bacterium]